MGSEKCHFCFSKSKFTFLGAPAGQVCGNLNFSHSQGFPLVPISITGCRVVLVAFHSLEHRRGTSQMFLTLVPVPTLKSEMGTSWLRHWAPKSGTVSPYPATAPEALP